MSMHRLISDYVRNKNQIKVNPRMLIIVHVCHVDLSPILSFLALDEGFLSSCGHIY